MSDRSLVRCILRGVRKPAERADCVHRVPIEGTKLPICRQRLMVSARALQEARSRSIAPDENDGELVAGVRNPFAAAAVRSERRHPPSVSGAAEAQPASNARPRARLRARRATGCAASPGARTDRTPAFRPLRHERFTWPSLDTSGPADRLEMRRNVLNIERFEPTGSGRDGCRGAVGDRVPMSSRAWIVAGNVSSIRSGICSAHEHPSSRAPRETVAPCRHPEPIHEPAKGIVEPSCGSVKLGADGSGTPFATPWGNRELSRRSGRRPYEERSQ